LIAVAAPCFAYRRSLCCSKSLSRSDCHSSGWLHAAAPCHMATTDPGGYMSPLLAVARADPIPSTLPASLDITSSTSGSSPGSPEQDNNRLVSHAQLVHQPESIAVGVSMRTMREQVASTRRRMRTSSRGTNGLMSQRGGLICVWCQERGRKGTALARYASSPRDSCRQKPCRMALALFCQDRMLCINGENGLKRFSLTSMFSESQTNGWL
jgi:hypothetical protein